VAPTLAHGSEQSTNKSGVFSALNQACHGFLASIKKPTPSLKETLEKISSELKKEDLDVLSSMASAAENTSFELRLREVLATTKTSDLAGYLDLISTNKITEEDFIQFISNPLLKRNLPTFKIKKNYELFIRALNGEESLDVKAFAHFHWKSFFISNNNLALRLRALSKIENESIDLKTDSNGYVSFLWYPKYPATSNASCTHTKIMVDGQVWGTMSGYSQLKKIEVHERLARQSFKDSYFEFKIIATPPELARIKYLLENNDRRGNEIFDSCVHGTCAALRESGVLYIPPPFNQLPSLAAMYLTLRKQLPGGVYEIDFKGKSKFRSLTSYDIVYDGVTVGIVIYSGYRFSFMIGRMMELFQ
jgi:hypothetical protein